MTSKQTIATGWSAKCNHSLMLQGIRLLKVSPQKKVPVLPSASVTILWYLKNGVNLLFYRKKKTMASFIQESRDIKFDISQRQGEFVGKNTP